jgi:hypothetical protein
LHRLPLIILSLKWHSPKASSCVTVPVTAGLWVRHIFNSPAQAAMTDESAPLPVQEAIRPTETIVLLDTSTSDSSDSDSDSEDIGRRSIITALQAFAGRTRRRAKGQTSSKQRKRQQQQTNKKSCKSIDTDTASESDSSQGNKEPPIARKFTPKPKKQSTLTSYNFGREKAPKQQTPKASEFCCKKYL